MPATGVNMFSFKETRFSRVQGEITIAIESESFVSIQRCLPYEAIAPTAYSLFTQFSSILSATTYGVVVKPENPQPDTTTDVPPRPKKRNSQLRSKIAYGMNLFTTYSLKLDPTCEDVRELEAHGLMHN